MKSSGYRSIFHIYLIFFLSLSGALAAAVILSFLLFSLQKPDGSLVRSDWPKKFTEQFGEQIVFTDGKPLLLQSGMERLQEEGIGLQILDASGREFYSFQKPEYAPDAYFAADLLLLSVKGQTQDGQGICFALPLSGSESDYCCLLYFPMKVSRATVYLNGQRFTGGKTVILAAAAILLLFLLFSGLAYGVFTARSLKRLITSIREIASRSYLPVGSGGVFRDLYDSLNSLDREIRTSDRLREQTEKMQEEWIANITHDLKTPLSPIRGYAELMQDTDSVKQEQYGHYARIILKNTSYMEALIDDLKLTYQLKNGMVPMKKEEQNLVRFLRELVIDILNSPEYEQRRILFTCTQETILFPFDPTLMTRAFRNLILNAFLHGETDTGAALHICQEGTMIQITVSDNGKGIPEKEQENLFRRYYRGTRTDEKTEGTGLGLAIVKNIVSLHNGTITVSSIPGKGTAFHICFPCLKVN